VITLRKMMTKKLWHNKKRSLMLQIYKKVSRNKIKNKSQIKMTPTKSRNSLSSVKSQRLQKTTYRLQQTKAKMKKNTMKEKMTPNKQKRNKIRYHGIRKIL